MSEFRKLVLQSFKKLHRTRMKVFAGDNKTLTAARLKINQEFSKNKHVKDKEAIKTMLKFAEDVENELRTRIIQAVEVRPGVYQARITEDTEKLDNTPFNSNAVPEVGTKTKCCKDQA